MRSGRAPGLRPQRAPGPRREPQEGAPPGLHRSHAAGPLQLRPAAGGIPRRCPLRGPREDPVGDGGLEVVQAATKNEYKKKPLRKNKSECKAHDHHTPPETAVGSQEVDQVRAAKRQRAEEPRMADAAEVPPPPAPASAPRQAHGWRAYKRQYEGSEPAWRCPVEAGIKQDRRRCWHATAIRSGARASTSTGGLAPLPPSPAHELSGQW
jgi:hypothetical protein